MNSAMKCCSKCKVLKNRVEYSKNRSTKDGLQYYCKDCYNACCRNSTHWRNSSYGQLSRKKNVTKFFQTEKGKQWKRIMKAKRRNLGYNQIKENIFSREEKIEWHHINNCDVIALPKDIHHLYDTTKGHKENLIPIIIQLYGEI